MPSRGLDKVHIFTSKILITSPDSRVDHLQESLHRDNTNKWSNTWLVMKWHK